MCRCCGVLTSIGSNRVPEAACAGCRRRRHALLEQYGWPGNVRELRNAIERAML
jgi:transcriptional regulator with PAS, ATPase and Fis domain